MSKRGKLFGGGGSNPRLPGGTAGVSRLGAGIATRVAKAAPETVVEVAERHRPLRKIRLRKETGEDDDPCPF